VFTQGAHLLLRFIATQAKVFLGEQDQLRGERLELGDLLDTAQACPHLVVDGRNMIHRKIGLRGEHPDTLHRIDAQEEVVGLQCVGFLLGLLQEFRAFRMQTALLQEFNILQLLLQHPKRVGVPMKFTHGTQDEVEQIVFDGREIFDVRARFFPLRLDGRLVIGRLLLHGVKQQHVLVFLTDNMAAGIHAQVAFFRLRQCLDQGVKGGRRLHERQSLEDEYAIILAISLLPRQSPPIRNPIMAMMMVFFGDPITPDLNHQQAHACLRGRCRKP
jgi:hypothetical protein